MKQSLWPRVKFYSKQVEIIHSVRDNVETYVPAGNMLGKDFVSGFIALWFFLSFYDRTEDGASVRVLTTSVKDDHLRVLWSEISMYLCSSAVPLLSDKGGPLTALSHELRYSHEKDSHNPKNYLLGCVSGKGEGMQGHHAKHTLLIIDEASGVEDIVYELGGTWAKKILIIGNPLPCANFFYKGVKAGDLERQV